MRPCRATRAGTQAPPLPISIIFFHAIPHKQCNHLRAILPNAINHPRVIYPNETVGAAPVCPPERPRSGVSIPKKTRIVCGEFNDGCAPVGRHGRAHRHRPYQTPLYIRVQSTPTTPTTHTQSTQTKRVNKTITHTRGRECIAHSRPHYLK